MLKNSLRKKKENPPPYFVFIYFFSLPKVAEGESGRTQ